MSRNRWSRVGIVALTAVMAAAGAAAPAQAQDLVEYVALGDSAAAGPLIPAQDINLLCLLSDHNCPAVVAKTLGAKLTDVSCSGATTSDLTGRRLGAVPPQFDALKTSTDLVSITIGANDSGLFQQRWAASTTFPNHSASPAPTG